MGKRMNARLEWKGRKLMCNGVCVAEVSKWGDRWSLLAFSGEETRKNESAARRAVERRFKMKVTS